MATTYKILGQVLPTTTTNPYGTLLYTVPASTSTVVSSITVTNVTSTPAAAYVYAGKAGATGSTSNALLYGTTVPANSTLTFTLGVTLATTDTLAIGTGTASALTFQAFGSEIA
jgi:hypothetical protein